MPSFINVSGKSQSNKVTRRDVKMGQVFVVKGKKIPYAHVGIGTVPPSADSHYRSINLKNGEEASTRKGTSEVTIVGEWKMNVDLHEDFAKLLG